MANFGLSIPWIAELNTETGKYSNAFKPGKATNTSVTPEYAEGSLYADNQEAEYLKEFKRAVVTVGTDTLPAIAKTVVFGHCVNDEGEEISNSNDGGKYVGYGFISREVINGVSKYMACILLKVKFNEGEESYETKGDSIVFKTPSISGNASVIGVAYDGVKKDDWRIKSPAFATEEEADQWIQTKFGVLEKCSKPTASVAGGTYTAVQSVTLTTSTTGAKIMYTDNGTTPSLTNGTQYTKAISVDATKAIKAIAYKDGAIVSDVMTEEYIIDTATTE